MNKKIKIILSLIFLPVTIIYFILYFIINKVQNNKIYNLLSGITISNLDSVSGYDFEEILLYLFRFFGYKTKLTKKSQDYGVDIFAKNFKTKYCIQAKLYYNHSVGASAIQQIETAKSYFACDFAVVVTNSKYSKQAVDMANKLKVILFDRADLVKMLNELKNNNKKFLKIYMEEKLCGKQ